MTLKKVFIGLVIVSSVILSGCNQGVPGGPGTTDNRTAKSPPYGQATETFNLTGPLLPTSLKQGERQNITIGIKRGTDFKEDVSVKFSGFPKGVTLDPSSITIKHGDADAKLTVAASDEASLGDFVIGVIGHPSKGADAMITFKVAISKK